MALETDPDKADFAIETERARCAADKRAGGIDKVTRYDRAFAWTFVNATSRYAGAAARDQSADARRAIRRRSGLRAGCARAARARWCAPAR